MELKKCKLCEVEKPLTDFYKMGYSLSSRCRKCHNIKFGDSEIARGFDDFKGTKEELEKAKEVLVRLGYDLDRSVPEQFNERFERWLIQRYTNPS